MEYVQPYFHARVKALLAVWSHKSGRFKPPGNSTEHEIGHKKRDRSAPRWKPKLEWKDRWVVIHNNILSLSKDNVVFCFEAIQTCICSMSMNRELPHVTSFRWLPCRYSVALIHSDGLVQL